MKFTNGYWRLKEGINGFFPVDIFEIKNFKDSLLITVACKTLHHRGDTLGGPFLNISLSSPAEDIIKVRITHFEGRKESLPSFIIYEKNHKPEIIEQETCWIFKTGNLEARINKKGWKINFFYNNNFLTDTGYRNIGYMTQNLPQEDQNDYWFNRTTNSKSWIKEELHVGVGEFIYGLGERFTPFIKNGQVVDIWNEDGGTASELAYKNIPFYISNKGYGVFVNNPGKVSFEICSEKVSRCGFSVSGESLEYFLISGESLKKVLENYVNLTGKPKLPPQWSFGLWLTTSFITDYDEKTISSVIEEMNNRKIPLHVFHFDCFWMKAANWCDFEWDRNLFPDPEGMIKRLKEKFNLKICVWINPYIAQQSKLFKEAYNSGYLLKKPDGSVWQCDEWQPGMGLVDFTNPAARKWFGEKLEKLCDMGVDAFKTDFGERIPTNVVWYDGSDPEKMHNYYTFLYNKTVFEILEKKNNRAILFSRSATAGSQQFPVHWGGDCSSNYDSMAETLRGGLSLGISGFGFWSHDISGFEQQATPDLYKRWVAFGLLSSHSRLHGNSSYRVPWLFDEEACDVLRHFVKLKCRLMPYIFAKATEACNKGLPLLRPMFLEFPDDSVCLYLDRQYMLGDSLLVAPIFKEDSVAEYYLPSGIWTDIQTNEKKEGGRWIKEKHNYFSLPLLARQSSVIPFGFSDERPDYDLSKDVSFHIFEPGNEFIKESYIPDENGNIITLIKVESNKRELKIEPVKAKNNWSIVLRNIDSISKVSKATKEISDFGIILKPDKKDSIITVVL